MAKLPLQRTRGVRDSDELSEENLVRDTRGIFGKARDFLSVKQNMTITLVCLAVPVAVMLVSLTSDHRVVDGAIGAEWLKSFKKHIENPLLLLL